MKNPDIARSFRPASSGAHGDSFVPAPSGFAGGRVAEETFEVECWLGYESIHPLTWVPGQAAADGGLRIK